jgi:hypothetical protein
MNYLISHNTELPCFLIIYFPLPKLNNHFIFCLGTFNCFFHTGIPKLLIIVCVDSPLWAKFKPCQHFMFVWSHFHSELVLWYAAIEEQTQLTSKRCIFLGHRRPTKLTLPPCLYLQLILVLDWSTLNQHIVWHDMFIVSNFHLTKIWCQTFPSCLDTSIEKLSPGGASGACMDIWGIYSRSSVVIQ